MHLKGMLGGEGVGSLGFFESREMSGGVYGKVAGNRELQTKVRDPGSGVEGNPGLASSQISPSVMHELPP